MIDLPMAPTAAPEPLTADQIALRARRIGALSDRLLVADDNDLFSILGQIEHHRPLRGIVVRVA